jgi:hypothetical protein
MNTGMLEAWLESPVGHTFNNSIGDGSTRIGSLVLCKETLQHVFPAYYGRVRNRTVHLTL